MALLWMDGFDHYSNPGDTVDVGRANMDKGVWDATDASFIVGGPSVTISRNGGQSLLIDGFATSNDDCYRRRLGAALPVVGVGFALYIPDISTATVGRAELFCLTNSANSKQITFNILVNGSLECRRTSAGGTLLGTTPAGTIVSATWAHIEFKAVLGVAGSVELRVNGVPMLVVSGVDTGTEASFLVLKRNGSSFFEGMTTYFDDMYAWDTTGTTNNDFLGDQKVITLHPTADTAQADWDVHGYGIATAAGAVGERRPDLSEGFIETIDEGATHRFEFTDLPAEGSVTAVMTQVMQQKLTAADCFTRTGLRSGASVGSGLVRHLPNTYNYAADVFEVDPQTSAKWTLAGVNASTIQIERTA